MDRGLAGEHLVMADLLLAGQKCFLTSAGCNYDIAIENGNRFVRLQIKTTAQPMRMNKDYANAVYLFNAKRAGRGASRLYSVGEFDGFAFVALDTRQIAYLPFTRELRKTVILRDRRITYKTNHGHIAPYIDEFPIQRFLDGRIAPGAETTGRPQTLEERALIRKSEYALSAAAHNVKRRAKYASRKATREDR